MVFEKNQKVVMIYLMDVLPCRHLDPVSEWLKGIAGVVDGEGVRRRRKVEGEVVFRGMIKTEKKQVETQGPQKPELGRRRVRAST